MYYIYAEKEGDIESQGTTLTQRYFTVSDRSKGDVNGNGSITSVDYLLCQRIFYGTYPPSTIEYWAADYDDDGVVDSVDYLLIKRIVLGY